jgi:putative phage-type endonuclease
LEGFMNAITHAPIVLSGLSREAWLAERRKDITSTEAAAILGVSPYATAWEVWQRKAGHLSDVVEETDRMRWGSRLEPVIAQGLAEDHGLEVRSLGGVYMRHPRVARMGASFDFEAARRTAPDEGWGLLEIKNVDSLVFRREWITAEGEEEAPLHIEVQVQHQLAVSGRRWACIGVLAGGNTAHLFVRKRDETAIAAIEDAVERFWRSIEANEPPSPDFRRDADSIRDLYANSDPTAVLGEEARAEIAALLPRFLEARAAAKAAKEIEDEIRARLLHTLGPVEKVVIGDHTITAKSIMRKSYVVEASTVRRLDIRTKAAKPAAG